MAHFRILFMKACHCTLFFFDTFILSSFIHWDLLLGYALDSTDLFSLIISINI